MTRPIPLSLSLATLIAIFSALVALGLPGGHTTTAGAATWTDLDVESYIRDHDVPTNPLLAQGYLSIGCWPCTRPVGDGEDPRSGRWSGLDSHYSHASVPTGVPWAIEFPLAGDDLLAVTRTQVERLRELAGNL